MSSRREAERRGRRGELIAMLWLTAKGYRVLGRRVRTPYGEVDVVCDKGQDLLVLVEVKAHRNDAHALGAVGPEAQRRIARAGLSIAQRIGRGGARLRFDVLIVHGWMRPPRHLKGAWAPGETERGER